MPTVVFLFLTGQRKECSISVQFASDHRTGNVFVAGKWIFGNCRYQYIYLYRSHDFSRTSHLTLKLLACNMRCLMGNSCCKLGSLKTCPLISVFGSAREFSFVLRFCSCYLYGVLPQNLRILFQSVLGALAVPSNREPYNGNLELPRMEILNHSRTISRSVGDHIFTCDHVMW